MPVPVGSFPASARAVAEIAGRVDDSIPPGKQVLSKLVDRIVFAKDMEETFGA